MTQRFPAEYLDRARSFDAGHWRTWGVLLAGLLWLLNLSATQSILAQDSDEGPAVVLSDLSATNVDSLYDALGPVLQKSGGLLTSEVRNACTDWARNCVMDELKRAGQTIPAECLAEVQSDTDLSDAMFRTVFPPDPSILQNYARLRGQMGPDFLRKYHSLVVAMAVAKRIEGVETNVDMETLPVRRNGQFLNYGHDERGNFQPGFWLKISLKAPKNQEEKDLINGTADFMRSNHVAAVDLYQDTDWQARLKTYLRDNHVARKLMGEVKPSIQFGEWLKNAMVILGQRPAAREKKPDTVTWLRYLTSLYESTPSSTPTIKGHVLPWPMFPLADAPWPLLMPLAHPLPLGEAKYVWETFQGEHGEDRYHTYGPYRKPAKEMPYDLVPSPWFWDAWPDRIYHGGECVPISIGTVDLYSGLGKPAVWAGQPGHANLISFHYDHGTWKAEVEQAYAGGPDVTYAQWYFDDHHGTMVRFRDRFNWAGAEYHLGLALGMNRGLSSYIDTRMAAYLYNSLPDEQKKSLGEPLLRSTLEINPFNPDIWYRLALALPDADSGMKLVQQIITEPRDDTGYWKTVDNFVVHYALFQRPLPRNEAQLSQICAVLQQVPDFKYDQVEAYAAKYYQNLADQGDAYGALRMAERYQDGVGVTRDINKARDYFSASAARGNQDAAHELNVLNETIPAAQITVTASSQWGDDQDVSHLVNGAGLWRGLHDNDGSAKTMWHTVSHPPAMAPDSGLEPAPAWVRFDFAEPQKFDAIWIWNLNQSGSTDRCFRKTHIYGLSEDGKWFKLTSTDTTELPRANGDPGLAASTVANSEASRSLKSVIIAAAAVDGNYGSDCYGLSAVRFIEYSRSVP